MEILVAILIIALIAAIAYAVLQRRPAAPRRLREPGPVSVGMRRRGGARHDPMAEAVAEHARATHPADVVVAEQNLQAQARNVAAGLHAAPQHGVHPGQPAPAAMAPGAPVAPAAAVAPPGQPAPTGPAVPLATDPTLDQHFDPATGERIDGYGDPANDPRLDDPRYDGRLARDWVDPREDDRYR
jgi:hypothetical protein